MQMETKGIQGIIKSIYNSKAEKQRNLNNLKPFVTFKKSIRFQKGVHYSSLESILFLII